jgi:hypothetical protein
MVESLTEKQFQRQVLDVARIYGWRVYHPMLSKWSERGFPDLTMVRPPRVIFAELKRDNGKLTVHQDEWAEMLQDCPGVEYFVWRPFQLDEIAKLLA